MSANEYASIETVPGTDTGDRAAGTTAIIFHTTASARSSSGGSPPSPLCRLRISPSRLIQFPNRALQARLLAAAASLQEAVFL